MLMVKDSHKVPHLWQIDHLIEKKKEGHLGCPEWLIAATDEHLQWWLTKDQAKATSGISWSHLCAYTCGRV